MGSWTDLTGNADHVSQATAGDRPTWKDAVLNGEPVLRFGVNANYFLQGAFTSGGSCSQPNTIFVVAKMDASIVNDNFTSYLIDGTGSSARQTIYKYKDPTPDVMALYSGTILQGSAPDSDWAIWLALFDGATSQLWIDGVSDASGDAGTDGMGGLTVGMNYSDSGLGWVGDIAEIIIYDAELSDADKNEVGNYLADRYNLSWSDIT